MTSGFDINSYWGPRRQSPAEIASILRTMLDTLAAIDSLFSNWTFVGETRAVPLDQLHHQGLTSLLGHQVFTADDGEPIPSYGYLFSAYTGLRTDPRTLTLSGHAGGYMPSRSFTNVVRLETRPPARDNEALLELDPLKAAMLAVVAAWDVTWASVYPAELVSSWAKPAGRPTFDLAWVTYLSPRFAPMIVPPRGVFVEHTPQGGIVLIATRDRFDVGNELHLAAARRIATALEPVNALPWPPDAAPPPAGR